MIFLALLLFCLTPLVVGAVAYFVGAPIMQSREGGCLNRSHCFTFPKSNRCAVNYSGGKSNSLHNPFSSQTKVRYGMLATPMSLQAGLRPGYPFNDPEIHVKGQPHSEHSRLTSYARNRGAEMVGCDFPPIQLKVI